MVRALIAVRGPGDVDGAVIEEQCPTADSAVRALNAMLFCASRPSPVPVTLAWMTSGLPVRSLPSRMSIACRRWTNVPFSFVRVTKYIVCDTGSIAGVPPMPMLPAKST